MVRTRSIAYPVVSRDAAFVVFTSQQANLVPGDTSSPDYFRKNLATGEVLRVNQPPAGGNSNGPVDDFARMSADGRFVAFSSTGSDLVSGDTNGVSDIFVRDMSNGLIERVSIGSSGEQALGNSVQPWISGDGRFVAFASVGTQLGQAPGTTGNIFIRDRLNNTTARVSFGVAGSDPNGTSGFGIDRVNVSDDGRWLTFGSNASNLVVGDSNGATDVFLVDRDLGDTVRISTSTSGQQLNLSTSGAAMSGDGSRMAYIIRGGASESVVLFDRPSGLKIVLNADASGTIHGAGIYPVISADGQFVSIRGTDAILQEVGDGNEDVFLFDLRTVMNIFMDGFE
jgi:Tol biopolymer transport system component